MTPCDPPGRRRSLNDTELYFEVHGTGEPVVLLHGFTGTSRDWAGVAAQWRDKFQLIVPDLRGHGRSGTLLSPFRHRDAAGDMLALLDHLNVRACRGLGVSGGGNVLLHMATMQPERIQAMVLVSATPYFPAQARAIMRQYAGSLSADERTALRKRHPGGDLQIEALAASVTAFAESHDDMNLTPPLLATIQARTLIVQGDRDPLYPVELSVEMYRAIPRSELWVVPHSGHGPVLGEKWPDFLETARRFLGE
jgi:pimeloyl-ACP methyl ester carboxylesterase